VNIPSKSELTGCRLLERSFYMGLFDKTKESTQSRNVDSDKVQGTFEYVIKDDGSSGRTLWLQDLWGPAEEMRSQQTDKKIRVAAYCRVSVISSDTCESLLNQVDHYTRLISSKDEWKFIGIYFDGNSSGRNMYQRQGFSRMLRHCEEGKIDLILVKNISRFSRNTKELIEILQSLEKAGTQVYFETENISSSQKDSQFLISTYAGLAQSEIETASSSIEWGFEKRFISGRPILGNIYGYERIEDKYKIIPKQAAIIRMIYNLFIEGMSLTKIAEYLMVNNVETYFNKGLWTGAVIKSILVNPSYVGRSIARKKTMELFSHKSKPTDGVRKQYIIEGGHPPIVDEDTFNRVQAKMKEYETEPAAKPEKIEFSSLSKRIKCGICGKNYNSYSLARQKGWRCPTRTISTKVCDSRAYTDLEIKGMLLRAFDDRFKLKEEADLKIPLRIIQMVNQNDHFEFHRLKVLNAIELAKARVGLDFTEEEITDLKMRYVEFEKKLVNIENDRSYRVSSIEWLKGLTDVDAFQEEASIDNLRAWVLGLTIYSEDDYEVIWIDDKTTSFGDCSPREKVKKLVDDEGGYVDDHQIINVEIITPETEHKESEENEMEARIEVKSQMPVIINQVTRYINGSNIIETIPIKPEKEKLRVAAYVRVSTENEMQMMSLKAQTAYYTYAILKNPKYEFVGIYADEGITGTSTKNRTEFNRMIEDCKAGKIDLIITKSISRFSRNVVDTLKYLQLLSSLENPTVVKFERENILSSNKDSSFMISLISAVSQEESRNIGTSIAWAKRSMAQRGVVRPGVAGYGFRIGKDHKWTIVEEEAEIVRRIYQEFLGGKIYTDISKSLIDEGVPCGRGSKAWGYSIVGRILTREEYRGNYLFQKVYRGDDVESKRVTNKGEKPQYLIENHHPAIIDNETWEAVQAEIAKRKDIRLSKKKVAYPEGLGKNMSLNKKFYCGECGNLLGFIRHRIKKNTNRFYYLWRCYSAHKRGCKARFFKQDFLETSFSQTSLDILMNPDFIEYLDSLKSKLRLNDEELRERGRLEELSQELNQELYVVVEGEIGKRGKDTRRVDELTEKIVQIKNQIKVFTEREERIQAVDDQLGSMRKELFANNEVKALESTAQVEQRDEYGLYQYFPEFNEEQFESWIEKGTVFNDGRVVFHFKSGFQWQAPYTYDQFRARQDKQVELAKAEEKARYFQGPEIKNLLKFCKEPKLLAELHEHFGRYSTKWIFKENIIDPLIKLGKIKKTKPDEFGMRDQRYYSGRTRKFEN